MPIRLPTSANNFSAARSNTLAPFNVRSFCWLRVFSCANRLSLGFVCAWSDLVDQKNLTALRTRLSSCGVSIFNARRGLPSDPNRGCTEEGTSIALDALYRQSAVVLVDLV